MRNFFRAISYVFHPLIMPFLGTLLLMIFHKVFVARFTPELVQYTLLFIFVSTFLIPAIGSYVMLKQGVISSLQMPEKGERKYPYLLTVIIYSLTWYMMNKLGFPKIMLFFIIGITLVIALLSIINIKYKISAHAAGVGGLVAFSFLIGDQSTIDFRWLILASLIIAGLVMSSRIYLKAHRTSQVYTGFLLGFIVIFISGIL